MRYIGRIKQLQVQRASLKVGEKPHRCYDPTPLLVVEKLSLTSNGVIGQSFEGERLIDIHNSTHHLSRNREENDVSLGFTSHYEAMRTRFGPHLTDGIAGENILIETATEQTLTDLAHGIIIESKRTGQRISLTDIIIAAPCLEFSQFAVKEKEPHASNEQVKEALQFLHLGRRGFYARLAGQEEVVVEVGDVVFVGEG